MKKYVIIILCIAFSKICDILIHTKQYNAE